MDSHSLIQIYELLEIEEQGHTQKSALIRTSSEAAERSPSFQPWQYQHHPWVFTVDRRVSCQSGKEQPWELFKHQRRGNRQPAAEEYSIDENYGSTKQELKEREALKKKEEEKKKVMGEQKKFKHE